MRLFLIIFSIITFASAQGFAAGYCHLEVYDAEEAILVTLDSLDKSEQIVNKDNCTKRGRAVLNEGYENIEAQSINSVSVSYEDSGNQHEIYESVIDPYCGDKTEYCVHHTDCCSKKCGPTNGCR